MDTELMQSQADAASGFSAPATDVTPYSSAVDQEAVDSGYIARSLRQLRTGLWPTLKYLTETEVHTYAFSVAACAILSFVPFFVLMATIIRSVFHSRPMLEIVYMLLERNLPTSNYPMKLFIIKNLRALVDSRITHGIQIMSLVMLFISSTGIFEPLEVALNKVWGFKANRSYVMNQVVSLGLSAGCGALALMSVAMTSGTNLMAKAMIPSNLQISILNRIFTGIAFIVTLTILKFFAVIATIAIFFFIYWLLPNGKVKPSQVFPAAVVTGLLLEGARFIYMLLLPLLDFQEAYGPFYISVTLIFWAFTAGMLLLGGAHLSAMGRVHKTSVD